MNFDEASKKVIPKFQALIDRLEKIKHLETEMKEKNLEEEVEAQLDKEYPKNEHINKFFDGLDELESDPEEEKENGEN